LDNHSENFNRINERKEFYYSVGHVPCKSLHGARVYFNRHGFNHLLRKNGSIRPINEVIERLSLLEKAVHMIRDLSNINEYKVMGTDKSKAHFWALIKKFDSLEIKVVIRKVGNGKTHFFSVYARDKK
jgi:hypothetical protein